MLKWKKLSPQRQIICVAQVLCDASCELLQRVLISHSIIIQSRRRRILLRTDDT